MDGYEISACIQAPVDGRSKFRRTCDEIVAIKHSTTSAPRERQSGAKKNRKGGGVGENERPVVENEECEYGGNAGVP